MAIGGFWSIMTHKLIQNFLAKWHLTFLLAALLTSGMAFGAAFQFGGIRHDVATVTAAAGTTTLTKASAQVQYVTGTTTQIVQLPASTTLQAGFWYGVSNASTGAVTVNDGAGGLLLALSQNDSATFYLTTVSGAGGTWAINRGASSASSGPFVRLDGTTPLTGNWSAGAFNIGIGTTPVTRLHQDNGAATATYHKFTAGLTTGTTLTDGFDLGIDSVGNAEVRQRENLPITFYTNNAAVASILANGRFAIGATTAAQVLDVNGDVEIGTGSSAALNGISGGGTARNMVSINSSNNVTLGNTSGSNILNGSATVGSQSLVLGASSGLLRVFQTSTSGTELFRIDGATGLMGLGVTPTVKFHQDSGTTTSNYHKFTAGTTTGTTLTDGFDVGIDSSGNAELRQREALPINFFTNNAQVATLLSNGNFGLGTTIPVQNLSFEGSAARTFGVDRASFGAGADFTISAGGAAPGGTNTATGNLTIKSGTYTGTGGGGSMIFQTPTNGASGALDRAPATRMLISGNNGFIGIGNTSQTPASALQIGANGSAFGLLSSVSTVNSSENMEFRLLNSIASVALYARIDGGIAVNTSTAEGGFLAFRTAQAGTLTETMRIDNTGSVGIGTTIPASTFQINGSFQVKVLTVTGNTTIGATDNVINSDDSVTHLTHTMPTCAATTVGRVYRVLKSSSINVTNLLRASSDLINGGTTFTLNSPMQTTDIICLTTGVWRTL